MVPGAAGARLHVREVGPPDAPAVLMLHGVGSSSRFLLEAFAGPLVDAGWRLVVADLRGHGGSTPCPDPNDHAHGLQVADVAALADHVAPRVIGGVSLGGHAAVGAAAAGVPCDAVLICLPAWSAAAELGVGPHAAVAAEVRSIGVAGILERLATDTTMQPWLREVLLRDWPTHPEESLAAALVALDGGTAPTEADVAGLTVPLAVVAWPDDPGHPLAVARAWVAAARNGHLEEIRLEDLQPTRAAMGTAAVRALAAVGVVAGDQSPAGAS